MIRGISCFNSVATILLAAVLCVYPTVRAALDFEDPALRGPGIPQPAWRIYRGLTPRYAAWARERVAEGKAETLSTTNISGTEWPLFGSVFYLWALENLQSGWEVADHSAFREPKVFARDAIIAASELVIDPKHATWVKKHWGADYLHRENVFYRMLVIAALTTRAKLLQDGAHLDLLRDQVESFTRELDASDSGLLNDYPGECYPGDVMAAIACVKRADAVLGTDHTDFVTRAVRGFAGKNLAPNQLPPYSAAAATGAPTSEARGCALSYMGLTGPELWPGRARLWFETYDKQFWQERLAAVGYREFAANSTTHSDWTFDVDAGPVVAGYGVSANAFGIGAARKNGRFDRAYPLATELLATVGELPNGMLIVPRLLSDTSDAPMLGEAAILWQLTVQPEKGVRVKAGGETPTYTFVLLSAIMIFGVWRIVTALGVLWRNLLGSRALAEIVVPAPRFQSFAWALLLAAAIGAFLIGYHAVGVVVFIFAVMLPYTRKKKAPKGTEGWSEVPTPSAAKPEPEKGS